MALDQAIVERFITDQSPLRPCPFEAVIIIMRVALLSKYTERQGHGGRVKLWVHFMAEPEQINM